LSRDDFDVDEAARIESQTTSQIDGVAIVIHAVAIVFVDNHTVIDSCDIATKG